MLQGLSWYGRTGQALNNNQHSLQVGGVDEEQDPSEVADDDAGATALMESVANKAMLLTKQ